MGDIITRLASIVPVSRNAALINEAIAEIERLRDDAKWLDWLEEYGYWLVPYDDGWRVERDDDSLDCLGRGTTLREAIEAAMDETQ